MSMRIQKKNIKENGKSDGTKKKLIGKSMEDVNNSRSLTPVCCFHVDDISGTHERLVQMVHILNYNHLFFI
jgi:hypothetical protein